MSVHRFRWRPPGPDLTAEPVADPGSRPGQDRQRRPEALAPAPGFRASPRVGQAEVEAPRSRNLHSPEGSAAAPRWARRRGGGAASG